MKMISYAVNAFGEVVATKEADSEGIEEWAKKQEKAGNGIVTARKGAPIDHLTPLVSTRAQGRYFVPTGATVTRIRE